MEIVLIIIQIAIFLAFGYSCYGYGKITSQIKILESIEYLTDEEIERNKGHEILEKILINHGKIEAFKIIRGEK